MDIVKFLDNIPACDIGAPTPTVLASEHKLILSYYTDEESVCQITFDHCFEFTMGMPDENLVSEHPLGSKGLRAYGFHLIEESSWIKEIEDRYHIISEFSRDGRKYDHYIFIFHDRSFECIASGYKFNISTKKTIKDSLSTSINEIYKH
ncbi:hypothetical protein KAZ93_01815 [Patescibacteria group bacterium]|nr:hypothetical protein [Patescibacteria group bacterium]